MKIAKITKFGRWDYMSEAGQIRYLNFCNHYSPSALAGSLSKIVLRCENSAK